MLAFHAWYKKEHPFCLKTKKDKKDMLECNQNYDEGSFGKCTKK